MGGNRKAKALTDFRIQAGSELEYLYSDKLHNLEQESFLPLLISPLWLRRMNMGQVDIARISPTKVELWEIKKELSYLSEKQYRRLQQTRDYISRLLKRRTDLIFSGDTH